MKYMDLAEFRELGLLQEVNRQFFHPRGLALELVKHEDGRIEIGGIQDVRDDPEGMVFTNAPTLEKFDRSHELMQAHASTRFDKFGWTIQPVGVGVSDE